MTRLSRLLPILGITILAVLIRPVTLGDATLGTIETAGSPDQEKSGKSQEIEPSVVGGIEADFQSFPWVVSISSSQAPDAYSGHRCGGTLIAKEWVLTSAHCVFDGTNLVDPGILRVLAGQGDLSGIPGQFAQIAEVLPHPEFNLETGDFDIALIRLASELEYERAIITFQDPLILAEANTPVTVIGWGSTESSTEQATFPSTLRKAELQLTDRTLCQEDLRLRTGKDYDITERMLCANSPTFTMDACLGDSGGPLLYWQPSLAKWVQIGIVSWGIGCAVNGQPGVYTDLYPLKAWIRDAMIQTLEVDSGLEIPSPSSEIHEAQTSEMVQQEPELATSYYYPYVPIPGRS